MIYHAKALLPSQKASQSHYFFIAAFCIQFIVLDDLLFLKRKITNIIGITYIFIYIISNNKEFILFSIFPLDFL